MTDFKSDVIEPNFDGALIENKYIKAGMFVVKTIAQRNATIKQLYRTMDGNTTTLCYVSGEGAIYELIANPSTDATLDSDWQRLDFGVSDILVAQGTWDADNTTPVLQDTGAVGNGNDFYTVTGAAVPVAVQHAGLFGGVEVTVKDGDWIISNGAAWFVSSSPIDWGSISNIPTPLTDYISGTVIAHTHETSEVNGLDDALALKYDVSNVGDHDTEFSSLADEKLIDVFLVKANFYQKSETYSQAEVDALIVIPTTTKGDISTHNGTAPARLGVGSDGEILVADSASPEGMKWEAQSGTIMKRTAKITISSAELLAIKTTPKVLIPAQGAGTRVVMHTATYSYNYGTSTYTGDVSTLIEYGSTGAFGSFINIGAATSVFGTVLIPSLSANVEISNEDIIMHTSALDPVGGDGDLEIILEYSVVNI